MTNRTGRRKASSQFNTRQVVVLLILFAFLLLVIVLFSFLYLRTNSPPAPSVTPTTFSTSTEIATATATETPTPLSQDTPVVPTSTLQIYIVKEGDTLFGIADAFNVSVEDIMTANGLTTDNINPGQSLVIPGGQSVVNVPTTVSSPSDLSRYPLADGDTLESIAARHGLGVSDLRAANYMAGDVLLPGQFITIPSSVDSVVSPPWKFSTINGDLQVAYSLSLDAGRFTLHYPPHTFPAQDPNVLAQLEMNGLTFLESFTGLTLQDKYDLYVAGSNFESPNRPLRGITFSSQLRTFFLHDGTGNADDQQYIAAHELTHLFMWNTVGSPSSTMVSEGMAVYGSMELIKDSEHMPIETFCAAYLQAGSLPKVSGSLAFLGHIADLQNYYASGCFVKYLVDVYGMDSLIQVYHGGDYAGIYGKTLATLETEWRDHLATVLIPAELNPIELVDSVRELEDTYESFFSGFTGNPAQLESYRVLDQARIALLEGRLREMHDFLISFNSKP